MYAIRTVQIAKNDYSIQMHITTCCIVSYGKHSTHVIFVKYRAFDHLCSVLTAGCVLESFHTTSQRHYQSSTSRHRQRHYQSNTPHRQRHYQSNTPHRQRHYQSNTPHRQRHYQSITPRHRQRHYQSNTPRHRNSFICISNFTMLS